LLDPITGESRYLNKSEVYQDAPVWSSEDSRLYYVQREGDELKLMRTDLTTGESQALSSAVEPLELQDSILPNVGYYGQFGQETLLEFIK